MSDSSDDEPLAFRKSKLVAKENGEPLAACEDLSTSRFVLGFSLGGLTLQDSQREELQTEQRPLRCEPPNLDC